MPRAEFPTAREIERQRIFIVVHCGIFLLDMLGRLLVARLVTISFTTTIKSAKAAFFVAVPLTSISTAAMPRRSPRRFESYAAAQRQEQQADEPDRVESFQTPKKRRRKVPHNHEHEEGLPSTPSTPDLCPSPTVVTSESTTTATATATLSFCDHDFINLDVSPAEFRPSASLTTGQSFHWTALPAKDTTAVAEPVVSSSSSSAWGAHDATDWIGTLRIADKNDSLVVHVRETPATTLYKILYAPPGYHDADAFLRDYFQLHVSLAELYDSWSEACPRLQKIAHCIPGVRMLQQDPWETLISFICCKYRVYSLGGNYVIFCSLTPSFP